MARLPVTRPARHRRVHPLDGHRHPGRHLRRPAPRQVAGPHPRRTVPWSATRSPRSSSACCCCSSWSSSGACCPTPTTSRPTEDPVQWFQTMLLPWITVAMVYAAFYTRLTRTQMLETLGEDYIRTARAKGLPERVVIRKHAFRAGLTPLVTAAGLDLAGLLGGAVVTEVIFQLPGHRTARHRVGPGLRPADHRRDGRPRRVLRHRRQPHRRPPVRRHRPPSEARHERPFGIRAVPEGPQPRGRVPHRGRQAQGRRRRLLRRLPGQDPGDRRRVRLRQERVEHGRHGPAQPQDDGDRWRGLARRRGAHRRHRRPCPPAAWREDGDDLPGPAELAASLLQDRQAARRGCPGPPAVGQEGRSCPGQGDARPRRHPRSGEAPRRPTPTSCPVACASA